MAIEVELKFPVRDRAGLERHLDSLEFQPRSDVRQSDQYFAHPGRDFASTDEALRIRSVGETSCLTYKGPKLDPTTKTRREIEVDLRDPDNAARMQETLLALGFAPAGHVNKRRREGRLPWRGRTVIMALDHVDDLGEFVEFEIVVDSAAEVDAARETIVSLAQTFGLGESDRRGYLEILQARS